jgi:hypothetical protein
VSLLSGGLRGSLHFDRPAHHAVDRSLPGVLSLNTGGYGIRRTDPRCPEEAGSHVSRGHMRCGCNTGWPGDGRGCPRRSVRGNTIRRRMRPVSEQPHRRRKIPSATSSSHPMPARHPHRQRLFANPLTSRILASIPLASHRRTAGRRRSRCPPQCGRRRAPGPHRPAVIMQALAPRGIELVDRDDMRWQGGQSSSVVVPASRWHRSRENRSGCRSIPTLPTGGG